jgi:CubicO group peptidase (beta-lactamase class C family)
LTRHLLPASLSILFFCLTVPEGAPCSTFMLKGDPTSLETTLDRLIGDAMASHGLPGLAVGVVKEGKTVYAKGFGVTDLGTGDPVTADTLFHVASVSKTFVATAILQLVETGKIELDDTVTKHLPYFRLDDDRYGKITIRHMLSHRSGMPDVRDYRWDKPEYDDGALERYVRGLADKKLKSPPGARVHYSNMAYEVLGDVIAKVSGQPFERYLKEMIFSPLGMEKSTFLNVEEDQKLRATPHTGFPDPEICPVYPYTRIHAPSSTLKSNAREMCHWIVANIRRGSFEKNRILKVSSYGRLWKPIADVGRGRSIACGWFVDEYKGHGCVLHGGADRGFQSYVILFPEEGAGVVILSNCTRFRMRIIKDGILDALLEEGK